MLNQQLTIGIISHNAADTITATLESIAWAGKILLLDDHSTDETVTIAKRFGAKILTGRYPNFAAKREALRLAVTTDWLFYIDTDEIMTPKLRQEIEALDQPGVYRVTRENYFLGTKMYRDQVERLFYRSYLTGWQGEVHESPVVSVPAIPLQQLLIHHTHRDITSMLEKTNQWSELEAALRIKAHHPPMAGWRLLRISLTETWHQLARKQVWRYGRAGLFEGYFQVIDKLIVYTKLWERQHSS